jgi:hypothetical protein
VQSMEGGGGFAMRLESQGDSSIANACFPIHIFKDLIGAASIFLFIDGFDGLKRSGDVS